jgi:hypothetical protein
MITIEKTRTDHRPPRITTLFVAESAPLGGTFFYYGNGHLGRYLRRSIEEVLAGDGGFLERFKSYGWYLDDLVPAPVNHLTPRDRKAAHLGAAQDLQRRIAEYRPVAIVCLLRSIGAIVRLPPLEPASTARSSRCRSPATGNNAASTCR